MRILIAGSHGQLAQALMVAAARDSDVRECAIGRAAYDLCAPGAIVSAMTGNGIDVVINTAAYTAVDQAETEEDRAYQLNCVGARRLAGDALRRSAAIIQLSTHYVFDGSAPQPYRPDTEPCPSTAYGRTKLAGERAVSAVNPNHAIVRTSWLHSATGPNFIRSMLQQAADRDVVAVVDGQVGSPTYAPHLASALLQVAKHMAAPCDRGQVAGIYHIANAGTATWSDLARYVFQVSGELGGPTATVVPAPRGTFTQAAPRPANACLDTALANARFAIQLPDWRDGAAACVREILHQGRIRGGDWGNVPKDRARA